MQKLILISEEKKELEKRGFLVKRNFTFLDLIIASAQFIYNFLIINFCGILFGTFIWGILALITEGLHIGEIIIGFLGLVYLFALLLINIYFIKELVVDFSKSGTSFFGKKGVISFGKISRSGRRVKNHGMLLIEKIYSKLSNSRYSKNQDKYAVIFTTIGLLGMFFGLCYPFLFLTDSIVQALIIKIIYSFVGFGFSWIIFLYICRKIFQSFHPLYAFGNLGEKIQKLTPTIESKSKEIQENFGKDVNFRVLSEGFDSLSLTFSEIVKLVIKLEQVEKKANKGNLFDSEKYINSLRGDIVEPLQSLKTFLEEQRSKLRDSQKERQKVQVRVGGNEDSASSAEGRDIGNIDSSLRSESELSSKRGESLMLELDENIGKLEEMIKKI